MSELVTHAFEGQQVRHVLIDGEPWWVGRDVCSILGFTKPRDAMARLDPEQRGSSVVDTPGGPQQMTVVNEDGLNDLILDSRKPEARRVRRWLTREVLPSIRRTGSYSQVAQLTRRDLAQMVIEEADRADRAEAEVLALTPRAHMADKILDATGDMSVADAAKALTRAGIPIGQNRLFAHLGRMGWTYRARADGRWRPTQTAIETGRLSSLPQSHTDPHTGELVIDPPQVRVTPKGLQKLLTALTPQRELEVVS